MPALLGPSRVLVDTRRAPRFGIVAPVRFRAHGRRWLEATTVNISRVGLLVRTQHEPPPPATVIQVLMALTTPGARGCAHVACTGRVVRVASSSERGERFMAATIEEFQIEPAGRYEEHVTEIRVVE